MALSSQKEEPTESDFELWKEALDDVCLSRLRVHSVGEYIAEMHWIHLRRWCLDTNIILYFHADSAAMDVYTNTNRKFNRYTKTSTCQRQDRGDTCLVDEIQPGVFQITSMARKAPAAPIPDSFLDVFHNWGRM
jgi:hypothetical protein